MLKVRIDASLLDTVFRQSKAMRQIYALEKILNSEYFAASIMKMPDKFRECEVSKYLSWGNYELYHLIMSGKEEWNSEVDNEVDIILQDYNSWWSKVLAYVIPGKKYIHVNTKYFDQLSDADLCANLVHEWTHLLGFKHAGYDLTLSFSYYIGEQVKKLYRKLILDNATEDEHVYKRVCVRKWYYLWLKKKCYLVRE